MWKFAAGAFGFFGMAWAVSSGLSAHGVGSVEANKPLEEILGSIANDMRSKRGQAINGMVIEGANVRGNTLILDFIIPNAPKRFNAEDASVRATQNMVTLYCNKKFTSILRRGTVIVHRFQSKSGLDLVDGRLDAATCKFTG